MHTCVVMYTYVGEGVSTRVCVRGVYMCESV